MNLRSIVPEARQIQSPSGDIAYLPTLHSILETPHDVHAHRRNKVGKEFHKLRWDEEEFHGYGAGEACNIVLRTEEYAINEGFFGMLKSGNSRDPSFINWVIETAIPATLEREILLNKACSLLRDVIEPFHFLFLRKAYDEGIATKFGWSPRNGGIYLKASESRMNSSQLAVLALLGNADKPRLQELYQRFVWSPIWHLELEKLAKFPTSLELFNAAIMTGRSSMVSHQQQGESNFDLKSMIDELSKVLGEEAAGQVVHNLDLLEQGPKQRKLTLSEEAAIFYIISTNDFNSFLVNPKCKTLMDLEERQIYFEFVLSSFLRYSIESAFRSNNKKALLDLLQFVSYFKLTYHERVEIVSICNREYNRRRLMARIIGSPLKVLLHILPPLPTLTTLSELKSPNKELNFETFSIGTLSIFNRNKNYLLDEYMKYHFQNHN